MTGEDDSTEEENALESNAEAAHLAQRRYDPSEDGELSTAIVMAVAEARGVSPLDVRSPPLYDCIDVTSLEDVLFGSQVTAAPEHGLGTVEFPYTEFLVRVRSDGWIRVYRRPSGTDVEST